MNKLWIRAALVLGAGVLALALAEIGVRMLGPGTAPAHETYLLDADGAPTGLPEAEARGVIEYGPPPRGRPRYVAEHTFYMCYRGGQRPSMDERGCVRVDINALGLRDRADLTWEKPAGVRRIVCLGDSFTFGWGVASDRTWVHGIEQKLGREKEIQAINCGLAGTLLIDESWWELRDRWGRFEPDVVLLTVCLNDLAPMPNTIALFRTHTLRGCATHQYWLQWECADCVATVRADQAPSWLESSRLYQLLRGGHQLRTRTHLDPSVDWGQWLLDMPTDWLALYEGLDQPKRPTYYELQGIPPEATWRGGGPQRALVEMRDWCRAREVRFGVVVWPLLQGLGADEHYPFDTLHRVVREFCTAEEIPHLDLLDVFTGHESADLWVDPADMHANEDAHALAIDPVAAFVRRLTGW